MPCTQPGREAERTAQAESGMRMTGVRRARNRDWSVTDSCAALKRSRTRTGMLAYMTAAAVADRVTIHVHFQYQYRTYKAENIAPTNATNQKDIRHRTYCGTRFGDGPVLGLEGC